MAKRLIEGVNRKGIKVRGQWVDFSERYEGIPYEEIEVGREYEVKFVKDEEGRWWVSAVYSEEETGDRSSTNLEERDKRIARMNALTNATQLAIAMGIPEEEEVIKIAERFYRYIVQD